MKNFKVISVVCMVLFIVFSCGLVNAAAQAPAKVVVGIVFSDDQFMNLMQLGFKAAAKEAGFTCIIANSANELSKESKLINTYIDQKVDGIAISPISETKSMTALKKANKAGIQVAVCNTNISKNNFIAGGYTSDNFAFCAQTGAVAAAYIKKNLKDSIKIGILQFKSALPKQSDARVKGFLSALKKAKVKYTLAANKDAWTQEDAITAVTKMLLADPSINLVFAANEGATLGATLGIAKANLKVVVFGTDASEQIVSLLKNKNDILQAVTGQDPYAIGYKTMKALINAINGGNTSLTKGKTIIVPGLTLRRDNVAGLDAYLTDLKSKN